MCSAHIVFRSYVFLKLLITLCSLLCRGLTGWSRSVAQVCLVMYIDQSVLHRHKLVAITLCCPSLDITELSWHTTLLCSFSVLHST